MKPAMNYYGVRWGRVIKIERATNPRAACKQAFGQATTDMQIKLLTSDAADLRRPRKVTALLGSPESWSFLPPSL